MPDSHPRAVVLVSGGLDSATTLAIALAEGASCVALTFRYGQRHHCELEAARRLCRSLGVMDHRIMPLSLGQLGGSSLTDPSLPVPADGEQAGGIPSTYVPARNTVFLAHALAVAEVEEADRIYIGVNAVDYGGYPDCRPEFVEAFQRLARFATRQAVEGRPPEIRAPLLHLSKAEIIRRGVELGLDYSLTVSCYDPDGQGRACGRCNSCRLRRRGFEQAGVPDPTRYQPGVKTGAGEAQ